MSPAVESQEDAAGAEILKTILFVEDTDDDYVIARYQLQKLKLRNPTHRVATVVDMMSYLQHAHRNRRVDAGAVPCVIVIDMGLPQASGLDAQAGLRSSLTFRDIPIIAISGAERLNTLRAAVDLGASGYLLKPFHRTEFCKLALKLRLPLHFEDTVIADLKKKPVSGHGVLAANQIG